jgi:hypothetical protein
MPTKDSFTPDYPLPVFLSERADEPEQPGIGIAWDRAFISSRILKTSILVVTATAIAILWVENPAALFANVTASLVDISAFQLGTVQSTPTIQSTADAHLPPTARDAPTRDEMVAALEPADQSQIEINELPAEALVKQFQAWAAEQDAQAQVVQPAQDARAQDGSAQPVQDAPAQVRPMQKHRHVRRVQNARAEIRPERHPHAKVRREQNARAQVAPVQDPRAQDQSVQNAQAPSLLQSFGWR